MTPVIRNLNKLNNSSAKKGNQEKGNHQGNQEDNQEKGNQNNQDTQDNRSYQITISI